MVYCRGCGKEIHEEAPTCPNCGAPQAVASKRTVGGLVAFSALWTVALWLIALFMTGFFMGIFGAADDAEAAGAALAGPYFLLAMLASGVLTYWGKLPGTRKL